jgi:hypothetical protein
VSFSSADASHTDHSFATGKLIEVNFCLFCVIREDADRVGTNSATRANRQASLRCLGMFRRNLGLVQTRFHDAFSIDVSRRRSVKIRMREMAIPRGDPRPGETPERDGDRPHPAADGGSQSFRIGGHDRQNETSQDNQSADKRPAY